MGSSRWISVKKHQMSDTSSKHCLSELKSNGYRIVATSPAADPNVLAELEALGVTVWSLPGDESGRVDLAALAARLGEAGYTNTLVEGGGVLAGALLGAHLADVVQLFVARGLLLGGGGPGWAEGLSVPAVPRALRIARSDLRSIGPDWLLTLVPESAQWWDPETAHV
jgi:riboflavin biosynthesis pyrimidine reductase